MLVRVVTSFSAMVNGEMQPWPMGQVAELPDGVNWLDLGWVVPAETENAADASAAKPKARTKKAKPE